MRRGLLAGLFLSTLGLMAQEVTPDYTGPSLLNRATESAPVEGGTGLPPNFVNLFAFGDFTYDSGLLKDDGRGSGVAGFDTGAGIQATHAYRRGSLALSYTGGYRKYPDNKFNSGSNHNFGFSFNQVLTRRLTFNFGQSVAYLLYGSNYFFQAPDSPGVPIFRTYDNHTRLIGTFGGFTYQYTRRLSVSVGGSFYQSDYSTPGLISNTGYSGNGSLNYRLSRRDTVSAGYSYSTFRFSGDAGSTHTNTISGGLQHAFSPRWEAGFSAGVSSASTSGTVSFLLASQARNIGATLVTGRYAEKSTVPYFDGRLTRRWKTESLVLSAGQSVTPGNGIYLTSKTLNFSGSYNYNPSRRWAASASFLYSRFSSLTRVSSFTYTSSSIGLSYAYQVSHHVGFNAQYAYVNYGSFGSSLAQNSNRIQAGIQFSLQQYPVLRSF